jgi:hypothetical protein
MPVSMFTVSVPVFIAHLNGLSTVLDKAAAWGKARKVNEADLLNMRLSPDMFSLARLKRPRATKKPNASWALTGAARADIASNRSFKCALLISN